MTKLVLDFVSPLLFNLCYVRYLQDLVHNRRFNVLAGNRSDVGFGGIIAGFSLVDLFR